MKIVKSIESLYLNNLVYFNIIKKIVDDLIKINKNERWHYESRIKQLESFALKIEMGRFDNKEILNDLFAATIVVKNLTEISIAEKFVSEYFKIRFKRPSSRTHTHKDTYSFPFDDLRIYVSLKDQDTGELDSSMYDHIFEIQLKTFLQHAWSIATHDLIYKSDKIDWAKERIAYQVKASLEQAEITISGVDQLSMLDELTKANPEVKYVNKVLNFILNHWKPDDLPSDRRRLAKNIIGFIESIGLKLDELNKILIYEKERGRGTLTRNLSPYLIVVQSVFNTEPERVKVYLQDQSNMNKLKILITSEMTTPSLDKVHEKKIIRV